MIRINLTWPKLIIAAVIAGVFTAVMAIVPALHDTSFLSITATIEVWILFSILTIMNTPIYSTELMGNNEEHRFDDSYPVYLEDARYGVVEICRQESVEDYFVRAELRRTVDTVLTLVSPTGEESEYKLHIERENYTLEAKQS